MITLLAIAFVFGCVGLWCFVTPLRVAFRAPDGGDLFVLTVRHPAVNLEIWMPPAVPLMWAIGEPELPPMTGEILGIPIDRGTVTQWLSRGLRLRAWRARRNAARARSDRPKPKVARKIRRVAREQDAFAAMLPGPLQAPAHLARATWRRESRRMRASAAVEVFSVDLIYGTGDPATTGMLAGFFWQLAASLPEPYEFRATADWTGLRIAVEGEVRVAIFPPRALWAAVCFAFAAWSEWRLLAPSVEEDRWQSRTAGTETPTAVEAEAAAPSNRS